MAGIPFARRTLPLLFVLLLAFLLPGAATGDEDLPGLLPGRWTFTLYSQAPEDAAETDAAFLTLEEGGRMTLLCGDADGRPLAALEGIWACEADADGTDRLTLRFTQGANVLPDGTALPLECVYRTYSESWLEDGCVYTYLILEDDEGLPSPFQAFYGEQGISPLGLRRIQEPNMRVVNCESFVSLREKPSTSSARLKKVPLGARVIAFPGAGEENGFLFCAYEDSYGYILSSYLAPVE